VIIITVIVLFIALGIGHVNLSKLTPFTPFGWKGIMSGAAIVFFAYIGFKAISTAAEETINPKKDVRRGLMLCLAVAMFKKIVSCPDFPINHDLKSRGLFSFINIANYLKPDGKSAS
jgi:amino acid transporter